MKARELRTWSRAYGDRCKCGALGTPRALVPSIYSPEVPRGTPRCNRCLAESINWNAGQIVARGFEGWVPVTRESFEGGAS